MRSLLIKLARQPRRAQILQSSRFRVADLQSALQRNAPQRNVAGRHVPAVAASPAAQQQSQLGCSVFLRCAALGRLVLTPKGILVTP